VAIKAALPLETACPASRFQVESKGRLCRPIMHQFLILQRLIYFARHIYQGANPAFCWSVDRTKFGQDIVQSSVPNKFALYFRHNALFQNYGNSKAAGSKIEAKSRTFRPYRIWRRGREMSPVNFSRQT